MGVLLVFACPGKAQYLNITEVPLPQFQSQPFGIVLAPSAQTLFIDQFRANSVLRLNLDGTSQEFPIPTPESNPTFGVTGPDGAHWFVEFTSGKVGRLNPQTGKITEFVIPSKSDAGPFWIVSGRDGALWFTNYSDGSIGRVTTSGEFTLFPVPTPHSGPNGLAVAWDGSMYFVEENADKIGRITTSGAITEYPLPGSGVDALAITVAADGNLWFTEHISAKIARLTPSGIITEFAVPSGNPNLLASGPDGALWFTESYANAIGRITLNGTVTIFPVPSPQSGPLGVSGGPNGTVVFTELKGGRIGSFSACGLGLRATYSSGKIAAHFELGVTQPATWKIELETAGASKSLLNKQIAAVVPVEDYTFHFDAGALTGAATIVSSLANEDGQTICSESQSLSLGN